MYFLDAPEGLPSASDNEWAAAGLQRWQDQAARLEPREDREAAQALFEDPDGQRLLRAIFGNSPFLTRGVLADPPAFLRLLHLGPDAVVSQVTAGLKEELGG